MNITRAAAHKLASELRKKRFLISGCPMPRHLAIHTLYVNAIIPEHFISVTSLGRFERRNKPVTSIWPEERYRRPSGRIVEPARAAA